MQATKDSFYVELRNRLVAVDPQRTITIDGATRPAIVVAENEPPNAGPPLCDALYLHWGGARAALPAAGTLMEMECTISYRTKGTDPNGNLDRGRDLASLDSDVLAICLPPQRREVRLQHGHGGGPGIQHLLVATGIQRAGERAAVYRARGQRHRVLLSRGEPDMSSNPNAKHSQMAPLARAVRAYIAPVGRPSGPIAAFDPAAEGQFDLDSPPAPWLDLGWVENFQRTAATKYEALRSGPVGNITVQYRTQPEARLEFDLPSWGKLQMALAGGTQNDERAGHAAAQPVARLRWRRDSGVAAAERIDSRSLVLTNDQLGLFQVGDL